jgi:hypothetical protein
MGHAPELQNQQHCLAEAGKEESILSSPAINFVIYTQHAISMSHDNPISKVSG